MGNISCASSHEKRDNVFESSKPMSHLKTRPRDIFSGKDARVSSSEFEYRHELPKINENSHHPVINVSSNTSVKGTKSKKSLKKEKNTRADERVSTSEFEFTRIPGSRRSYKRTNSSEVWSTLNQEQKNRMTQQIKAYYFNEAGVLMDPNGNKYNYNQYKDHAINQFIFNQLGEMVVQHIYELMVRDLNMKKIFLPLDASSDDPQSFIFTTEKALTTTDRLLLLIHGSGMIRAGMWSRKLILNESIHVGSQLPFINRAIEEKYEVVVLNPNLNCREDDNFLIKNNRSPEEHGCYVWRNIISRSHAKNIAIVGHSYGGIVTLTMMLEKNFTSSVFAIALTDSVHQNKYIPREYVSYLKEHSRNWVCSSEPLDTSLKSLTKDDIPRVSAGVMEHSLTNYSSMDSIFKFFDRKYNQFSKSNSLQHSKTNFL